MDRAKKVSKARSVQLRQQQGPFSEFIVRSITVQRKAVTLFLHLREDRISKTAFPVLHRE